MNDSEFKLISEALRKGDNSYLKEIFREQSDFCIKRLMVKTHCSKEDAEDIFIDSIMNFREKIISNEITHLTKIRNYIYTTCFNMWSSRIQKQNVLNKRLPDLARYYYDEYQNDPFTEMEEITYHDELLNYTKKAFEKLSSKCQDILYFYHVEKYSLKEIVEQENLSSVNVAKVNKFRCLKQFIRLVEELKEKESGHVK